jgi:hypothetical protein
VIGGEDCAHLRWLEPATTDAAPAVGYEVQCAQYPHGEWRPCAVQQAGAGASQWPGAGAGGALVERTVLGLEPGAKYAPFPSGRIRRGPSRPRRRRDLPPIRYKFRVRAITAVGEAPFSADSEVLRLGCAAQRSRLRRFPLTPIPT